MTAVAAANSTLPASGGVPSSASGADDGSGFSDVLQGLDARSSGGSAGTATKAAAAVDTDAPSAPAAGDTAPAATAKVAVLRQDVASLSDGSQKAAASLPGSDKTTADASADTKTSPEAALLRSLTTSPRKDGKKPATEVRVDQAKPDAAVPSNLVGATAITLQMLLAARQVAAADVGATPKVSTGGGQTDGTTAADTTAAALQTDGPDLFAGLGLEAIGDKVTGKAGATEAKLDGLPRVDVSVLHQATWLPPAVTLDNLHQITNAVLIAAREGGGQHPSAGAPLATTLSSDLQNGLQSHTIVKSLTIQLQPNDLGTLRADMRLSGDTMTLHIAASRAETAQMLAADKDKLAGILKEAGLSATHVVVTIADTLLPGGAGNPSSAGQQNHHGGQTSDQTFAGGQNGFSGENRQANDQSPADRRAWRGETGSAAITPGSQGPGNGAVAREGGIYL